MEIPKPTPEYEALRQKRLQWIENKQHPWRTERLRVQLETMFVAAHGFSRENRRRPRRLFAHWGREYPRMVDHVKYYRSGRDCIWVSQPYEFNADQMKDYSVRFNVECVAAPEWSYHYPNWSTLIICRMDFDIMELQYDIQLEEWGARRRLTRRQRGAIWGRLCLRGPLPEVEAD